MKLSTALAVGFLGLGWLVLLAARWQPETEPDFAAQTPASAREIASKSQSKQVSSLPPPVLEQALEKNDLCGIEAWLSQNGSRLPPSIWQIAKEKDDQRILGNGDIAVLQALSFEPSQAAAKLEALSGGEFLAGLYYSGLIASAHPIPVSQESLAKARSYFAKALTQWPGNGLIAMADAIAQQRSGIPLDQIKPILLARLKQAASFESPLTRSLASLTHFSLRSESWFLAMLSVRSTIPYLDYTSFEKFIADVATEPPLARELLRLSDAWLKERELYMEQGMPSELANPVEYMAAGQMARRAWKNSGSEGQMPFRFEAESLASGYLRNRERNVLQLETFLSSDKRNGSCDRAALEKSLSQDLELYRERVEHFRPPL